MEYRALGSTGMKASVIGFGCNRIADAGDRREVEATLVEAVEHGINLFDTANSYSHGGSEEMLARVLGSRRKDLLLCSKVGDKHWSSLLVERWTDPIQRAVAPLRRSRGVGSGGGLRHRLPANFAPRFLDLGIAGSLRRLRTDYLDVLYLHSPPPEVLADPLVFQALEDIRRKGWVRCYGISLVAASATDDVLSMLARFPGIAVLQIAVHPPAKLDTARLATDVASRRVGIVARQALDKGALLSDASSARTLLRSVTQRAGIHSVLVGMRSRAHLRDNLASLTPA